MSTTVTTGAPSAANSSNSDYVFSYLTLRLTIGFVALNLPVLVLGITILDDGVILPSISDSFYRTFAISVFVGSMCAFAAFLWAYQFEWWESLLGNLGAIAAASVAIFPTSSETTSSDVADWVAVVHYISASAFFGILGIFCSLWWRESSKDSANTTSTGHPFVYGLSGAGIVVFGVLAILDKTAFSFDPATTATLFLLCEILMVELFGLSWIHRGGASAARSLVAAAATTLASLLLVFAVPTTGYNALATIAITLLAVLVALGLLWSARPKSSQNRYNEYVEGTRL